MSRTCSTIDPAFATEPNAGQEFMPYLRDDKLARPWAIPGSRRAPPPRGRAGEERGRAISYEAENHQRMTDLRAAKVDRIADDIPPLEVDDRTATPRCSSSGGDRRTARSTPRCGACATPGARWPPRT